MYKPNGIDIKVFYKSHFPFIVVKHDLCKGTRMIRIAYNDKNGKSDYTKSRYLTYIRFKNYIRDMQVTIEKINFGPIYLGAKPGNIIKRVDYRLLKPITIDIDLRSDYVFSILGGMRKCPCRGMIQGCDCWDKYQYCEYCFPLIKAIIQIFNYVNDKYICLKGYWSLSGNGAHYNCVDKRVLAYTKEERNGIYKLFETYFENDTEVNRMAKELSDAIFNSKKQLYGYDDIDNEKIGNVMPKFDTNLTSLTHLIAIPFSIHYKSGLICIPLSKEYIEELKDPMIWRIDNYLNDESLHVLLEQFTEEILEIKNVNKKAI